MRKISKSEAGKRGGFAVQKIRREAYYLNPNNCMQCSQVLPYDRYTSKRKFCNHSCAAIHTNGRRRVIGNTKCYYCCKDLVGRWNGKYCSLDCRTTHKQKLFIEQWLTHEISGYTKGGGLSDIIRQYLFNLSGANCWECGWSKINPVTNKVPLAVDHIDGNYRNCFKENLRLLCFSCHALTPTFGGLNRGKGRKKQTTFIERMGV